LNQRDGFVSILAVDHDPRQGRNVGKPAAVAFALDFDLERHGGNVPSGTAVHKAMDQTPDGRPRAPSGAGHRQSVHHAFLFVDGRDDHEGRSDMEWPQIATLSVTVVLAVVGYLATYLNNLRLAQRKDRLDRVERQLREFYGPLLSLSESSTRAWQAFRSKYRPGRSFWRPGHEHDQPTADEAVAWRAWMMSVFSPLNEETARLITAHADLIEEPEMPECLLELYAHVAAYRPIVDRWKTGDFSEHASLLNFPTDSLLKYARDHYRALKREQASLLGRSTG
jgi:hypothetical protein